MTTQKRKFSLETREEAMKELTRAVRRHLDKHELESVAENGAAAGWNGFIYYRETIGFYEQHSEAIFKLIEEDSEGGSIMKYIAMCDRNDTIRDYATFANFLSWYALESVAREVTGDE